MENYVNKTCPFCKAEFTEDDTVKSCPVCGIPHHQECWEENNGCATFGCSEHHDKPQDNAASEICEKCGASMNKGQAFCSRCGAPKRVPAQNVCTKCGAPLQDGQAFCPACGHKVGLTVDPAVNQAISQFNAGVISSQRKSKKLPIIIGISAIAVIGLLFIITNAISAKNAETAKEEYIADVNAFLSLSYTAATNVEDIADTIQRYWYENIWEDKHGYDINDAIINAMVDKSEEIELAEDYDSQLGVLYSRIKKIPSNVSTEDKYDLEEICSAVKNLYNAYCDFYNLATDPSGSYNTFSESNNSMTDQFISRYTTLDNLLG